MNAVLAWVGGLTVAASTGGAIQKMVEGWGYGKPVWLPLCVVAGFFFDQVIGMVTRRKDA